MYTYDYGKTGTLSALVFRVRVHLNGVLDT